MPVLPKMRENVTRREAGEQRESDLNLTGVKYGISANFTKICPCDYMLGGLSQGLGKVPYKWGP